jgi:hypothetical protein
MMNIEKENNKLNTLIQKRNRMKSTTLKKTDLKLCHKMLNQILNVYIYLTN